MGYCHKELVQAESDSILSNSGWINEGGGCWRKESEEEKSARIQKWMAAESAKAEERRLASLNWFQLLIRKILRKK
jgi:hypothetical protein